MTDLEPRALGGYDRPPASPRTLLRLLIRRHQLASESAAMPGADRAAAKQAADRLNQCDPHFWGGAVDLPPDEVADLIAASIAHRQRDSEPPVCQLLDSAYCALVELRRAHRTESMESSPPHPDPDRTNEQEQRK